MTDAEIRERLRAIRYSSKSKRYGRQLPSISNLGRVAGLSGKQLYRIAVGLPIGPKARAGLTRAFSSDMMDGARADPLCAPEWLK